MHAGTDALDVGSGREDRVLQWSGCLCGGKIVITHTRARNYTLS